MSNATGDLEFSKCFDRSEVLGQAVSYFRIVCYGIFKVDYLEAFLQLSSKVNNHPRSFPSWCGGHLGGESLQCPASVYSEAEGTLSSSCFS